MKKYMVGDLVLYSPYEIECVVVEINEKYELVKIKALVADPDLGRIGFFYEEGDWVIFNLSIVTDN